MIGVFVGYFSYATNYNRDLVTALREICPKSDELYLCGRIDEVVSDGKQPVVDKVWRKNWRYVFDILKYVDKRNPDIVYLHQEFKNYGGIITALLFPLLVFTLRLKGKVVVPTVHAVIAKEQIGRDFLTSFGLSDSVMSKIAARAFLNFSYFLIGNLSSAVTVHSPALQHILINQYHVSAKKVVIIESGVRDIPNPKHVPVSPTILNKFPQLKHRTILLIFGFFSPRKGFEVAIKAFSRFIAKEDRKNKYTLVLAGDVFKEYMHYKQKIERLISDEKAADNIVITGYVDGVEIDELFRLSKLVILPAVITFNISGALAFALAYRKPVLASGVGPLKPEVETNKIGLTYVSSSAKSCEKNLETILFTKSVYADALEHTEEVAKRRYWINIARQHNDLFTKLLNK